MPPLYVFDWIAFVPKQSLQYRQIIAWQIFPIAYAVVVMLRGALTGYYPYPFLDAGTYGYPQVAINIAGVERVFHPTFGRAGNPGPLAGGRAAPHDDYCSVSTC